MNRLLIKIIGLLLLCMTLGGCRPRGVLSNRQMRNVLYDLHRADAAIQVAGYSYLNDQEVAGYYKNVLDKHGITQAEFDSSLVWYTDNPQIFNKIYPKVLERLEADFEVEKRIREKQRQAIMAKRSDNTGEAVSLREIDEVMNEMQKGLENPWKLWRPEEFCKKNIIIFGQLEKK